MPIQPISVVNVEQWNDTFARTHDIDEYYARSSILIRWIEQRRLSIIRRMMAAQPDDRILEIGCGGGHVLRLFPQSDLTGIDVSGEMLRRAQRNLRGYRTTLLKGEVHELNLPSASFDKIVCTEVLEHVVDPDAILDQMKRLVRPGGRLVITFPNDALVGRIKGAIRGCGLTGLPPFRRIAWGGDEYHLHVWRVAQMRAMLTERFAILRQRFAPGRWLPVRCCFLCSTVA